MLPTVRHLPYAADRLTGAERHMAARLGVGPGDRAALAAAIRAVLDREPDAVADAERRLTALRGQAAAQLRFETAGRIQSEMEALRWVTAVQRATTLDGADLTFDAWADGVLVRFAVRRGRLCEWGVPAYPHRSGSRTTARLGGLRPAQRRTRGRAVLTYISLSRTLSASEVRPGRPSRRA